MSIESAVYTDAKTIRAVIDGETVSVPDDPANRHRRRLAEWQAAGGVITPYQAPEAAPERRLVAKTVIIDRLEAAGKLTAARAALDSADLYTRERWNARDAIYADDPTACGLIAAIGANPDVILAP